MLSNVNRTPGNTLWSQTFTNQLGGSGSLLSVNNLNGPMLNAGSSYWLVAATDLTSLQSWSVNNTGIGSNFAINDG
jgi:hypothetical protein